MSKFGDATYDLSSCRLRHPTSSDAKILSEKLASSTNTYAVIVEGEPVGIISVRYPWLLGPYLGFLGIIPQAQGKGLGKVLMNWLEFSQKYFHLRFRL